MRITYLLFIGLFLINSCSDKENEDLRHRVVSLQTTIDSLKTVIATYQSDYFPKLPTQKKVNKKAPKKTNNDLYSTSSSYQSKSYSSNSYGGLRQCEAITKKGTRCKRMIRSGRCCWQHG
jgi:hypothetical protein